MTKQTITVTNIVLETQSPMAINTGRREVGFDTELARDINGLPMIPATAIAGVWSHIAQSVDPALKEQWFGNTTQASSLTISNGSILSSYNQLVDNYLSAEELAKDPVLALCLQDRPHHRDRVAINDRGVAKETGKFDQILLPKGIRFAITLQWNNLERADGIELTQQSWLALLQLWFKREFAFGSSTRNGLGRIKIVASETQQVELTGNKGAGSELTKARQNRVPQVNTLLGQSETQVEGTQWTIPLKALDNWRCGKGIDLLSKTHSEHSVNIVTYTESAVQWNNNRAFVTDASPVLCGSSIKGILAHRVAYHYRKHTQQWAETMAEASHEQWQQRPEQLKALFGLADDKEHDNSIAGSLWVEDADIHYDHLPVIRHHNSIDRFTGGVRKGALYSEELIYQPRFTLHLYLSTGLSALEEPLQEALKDTIQDLELGLLPMGAGSGRGTSLVIKDTAEAL
ncbi:hypothetical protein BCS93_18155 [Vibrio breoganii]|uniref:CRISPR type III-associated protein domain-containing protein n=2 Tax=Vibrio TaxID=662 RepID=A0AAP8MSK4_9VIBR|nr:RAMP superfamily CRISPR-associated protein [Vibrio breoganii]PMP05879.1 hypothetical protein BCS93_18155 [Vibrio breoganii]